MRLGGINISSSTHPGAVAGRTEAEPAGQGNESRALVPLVTAADPIERQASYRHAPFLAQLIATKDQHPQTRERRRAEPTEVLAAYREAATLASA